LLEQGKLASEQGDFTQAINSFNRAMGYLRQASRSHPLLEEVQKQIRITKGRSLVQRYNNRRGLQSIEKNVLLSLREESEEVIVNQCLVQSSQEKSGILGSLIERANFLD